MKVSRERTTKYEGYELVQIYGFFRIYLYLSTEHFFLKLSKLHRL